MKNLTLLIITSMLFIGCDENKSYPISSNNPLKIRYVESWDKNICIYTAYLDNGCNRIYFIDSCNKYSVGDTIKFSK